MYGIQKPTPEEWGDVRFGAITWLQRLWQYVRSRTQVVTVTAATYTIPSDVFLVRCDCTSNSITLTLPKALGLDGRQVAIKKIDSSANTVTLTRSGSDTIDGATTAGLASQYAVKVFISNGITSWDRLNVPTI